MEINVSDGVKLLIFTTNKSIDNFEAALRSYGFETIKIKSSDKSIIKPFLIQACEVIHESILKNHENYINSLVKGNERWANISKLMADYNKSLIIYHAFIIESEDDIDKWADLCDIYEGNITTYDL